MNIAIQGFTGVYMGEHSNTGGVYRSIHGCTCIYRGLQEYPWVYITIQGFTGVYRGEHSNKGVCRSMHG